MKGVAAAGHPLTARAAVDMLAAGGNAFDAVVSAGFASVAAEPALTSLGGGGFMLAHIEKEKKDILFDFFVNTPGLGADKKIKPVMTPTDINFPGCVQVFHTGPASVAVPGVLKGLLHIHDRLCTLPLSDVIAPALSYLENGVENIFPQDTFLGLLEPICTAAEYGREIYMHDNRYVKKHDMLFNPLLKRFLEGFIDNTSDIYSGEAADMLAKEMEQAGGLITQQDLESYEVVEREPLRIRYRDRELLTNPPPSSGGVMLAFAMHLLENINLSKIEYGAVDFYTVLIELMKEMHEFRPMKNGNNLKWPFSSEATDPIIRSFIKNISERTFISTQGTTHISIIDAEGNASSMTTSNGSGSGCFIPGTGIMLNNMMGEDDLHPDGFFSSPSNMRVSSMMMPTITLKDGRVGTVLGSGGSKRIKTAILQTLINIIDHNCSLQDAVERPRIHFEDGMVQVEPDVSADVIEKLGKHYELKKWEEKNMYFGGVHCVNHDMSGWGDSRRGGCFVVQR